MFRNLLAAALIGPPVAALTIFLVPALIIALGSGGIGNIGALPVMLIYAIIGGYFFGIVPALLGGVINGIVETEISSPGKRLLVAMLIGAGVAGAAMVCFARPPSLLQALPNFPLFLTAGAMAGLASAAMAAHLAYMSEDEAAAS
jgi:hypothetical protein